MANEMLYSACAALFERNQLLLKQSAHELLERYAEQLIAESENQNVTAVRTLPEIWNRHFLDSAFLLQYLPEGKALDLGTGGGIPAIPLAIMNRNLDVTMLDSELRKIEFCKKVIDLLGIHATAICVRAEELSRSPEYDSQFDNVVSRAMANGSMLTELSARFLKIGGKLLAMKGRQYNREQERFHEAAEALGMTVEDEISYRLEDEDKYLIVLRKDADTPAQYPRRYAKMKRSPL